MLDVLKNLSDFRSFFLQLIQGLVYVAFTGILCLLYKVIRNLHLNKKYPVKGQYITFYEDIIKGKKSTLSAPATIRQKGFKIKGKTTLEPGKTWILEGKIYYGGHICGVYHAESPHDVGVGNFFLKINADGNLEGIWTGYDNINKTITSGHYRFNRVPKIKIQPFTGRYRANVLDLSSRLLGKGYLPNGFPESESAKDFLLIATLSKKLIGFNYSRIMREGKLKVILKNRQINIPPDIKHADEAGTLGLLKTMCIEPEYQGHGVGTKLIEECLNKLTRLGSETIISIAWETPSGIPISGIFSRFGFHEWVRLENFWREESISQGYSCPVCGTPCNCPAVLYKRSVSTR